MVDGDEIVAVARIGEELGMRADAILALARRKDDPLPARVLKGKKRGAFAFRSEINEWVRRNSCPVTDKEAWSNG